MFEQSNSKRILAAIALIAAAILIVYFLLFIYINHVASEATELRGKLAEANRGKDKFTEIESLMAETAEAREQIGSYMLTKDGVVRFIEQVEKLGKDAGVKLEINSVSSAQIGGSLKKTLEYLVLSATGEGDWKESATFLSMMEHLPYQANINRVLIEKTEVKEGAKEKTDNLWRSEYQIFVLKKK